MASDRHHERQFVVLPGLGGGNRALLDPTLHAYQSWLPDHRRGYVKQGVVRASDARAAERYRQAAMDDAVTFDQRVLHLLHAGVLDIAAHCRWRVHAVFGEATHLHVVLSWADATAAAEVRRLLANLLSKFLGEWSGLPSRRWFARRPSFQPIRDRLHFERVVDDYRAKHRMLQWREGDAAPQPLAELLKQGPR